MKLKSVAVLFISMMLVFGMVACRKEGPAERAGKQLDKAAKKAGEGLQDLGKKLKKD